MVLYFILLQDVAFYKGPSITSMASVEVLTCVEAMFEGFVLIDALIALFGSRPEADLCSEM